MAEWVGFEPTVPLPVHLISSQGRYNHFDTTPDALIFYRILCGLSIVNSTLCPLLTGLARPLYNGDTPRSPILRT